MDAVLIIPNRVCMVCFDARSSAGNALLCCNVPSCHMRVHEACYAADAKTLAPSAVRAQWSCDVCTLEKARNELTPNAARVCVICKHPGGALKPTTQANGVCHLVCARWLPELKQVASETHPSTIVVDTKLLYATRHNLKCFLCNKRGGCMQCSSKRCPKSFHALCAVRAPASKVFTGLNDEQQPVCHCETHLGDVQPTFTLVKDLHYANPYVGDKMYEPDAPLDVLEATTAATDTPATLVSAAALMPFFNMPMSAPPAKKVGRPRKDDYSPKPKPSPVQMTMSMPQGMPRLPPAPPGLGMLPTSRPAPPPPGLGMLPPRPQIMTDVIPCPLCKEVVLRTNFAQHMTTTCKKQVVSSAPKPPPTKGKAGKAMPSTTPTPTSTTPTAGKATPTAGKATPMSKAAKAADGPKKARGRPPKKKPELSIAMPLEPSRLSMSTPMSTPPTPLPSSTTTHVPMVIKKHATTSLFPLPPGQAPIDPVGDLAIASLHATMPSDNLFMTWPGQQFGHLMQSAFFWDQVSVAFFSKYPMQKKRLEPLAHWLTGAKPDGIEKPRGAYDKPRCADTVVVTSSEDWMVQTGMKHTCDYMLLASGAQCAFDQEVHPFLHVHSVTPSPASDGTSRIAVNLVVHSTAVRCTFALSNTEPPADADVAWTRFKPDAFHDLLTNATPAYPRGTKLWVALLGLEPLTNVLIKQQYGASAAFTGTQVQDDMTLEMQLCVDLLNEQMKTNRVRWRSLWAKGTQYMQAQEAQLTTQSHVERLYLEYAWWKAVCLCLIKGTNDLPIVPETDRLQPFEDGTCVICFDGISEDANPIIFCEACDIAVHQRCYGVAEIPKTDFYCDKCIALRKVPSALVFCQLCPMRDGALKMTKEGLWVHVACALWSPNTQLVHIPRMLIQLTMQPLVRFATFDTATAMTSPLADVADLPPPLLSGGLCTICRVATGRTVRCRHPDCDTSMHALCAWYAGLHMHASVAACGFVHVGGGQGLVFNVFCDAHQPSSLACSDRSLQRDARAALRLVEATKRQQLRLLASDEDATCAVCNKKKTHELSSPLSVLLRCRLCSVVVHPSCVAPELSIDTIANDWACEKCAVDPTAASAPCVLCDRVGDYMLPVRPLASTGAALHFGFVHLYCASVFGSRIVTDPATGTRHALPLPLLEPPTTKCCSLCQQRSGRLVSCCKKQCLATFHPYCHREARLYNYTPGNKTERAYCCTAHPPSFAIFDEAKGLWITKQEIMALQQIRCTYERTRMFIDLTKQREKTKKRLFLHVEAAAFEKAKDVVAVVKPTRTMKTFYASVTGDDDLRDVTRRKPKEVVAAATPSKPPQRGKKRGSETRQELWLKKLGATDESIVAKRPRRRSVDDDDANDETTMRQQDDDAVNEGTPSHTKEHDTVATWWHRALEALPPQEDLDDVMATLVDDV
ncbi:hypothetical protein SPRG_01672 [Saprolegnia parasitica CBS 223.65]|uniref:PHD-type domain-containing protein n=1 Tax=Saprolegnia parasitica (strain CBS 223.65) TaxID=695850 RepID=A0A067CTH0_SAPPC|nr:hypothetical protein SPRG_01672 [Saprolegnia parasitica CBS 223.65]KDO33793.1 hypothetical protein SPRG_01672 [Saprolegnia parasitica CBS 223.65]|eukprot:XP_012195429.1 hypothetical protein SPRG_01672 [Saprolegnia parasitica CBS 223.65]